MKFIRCLIKSKYFYFLLLFSFGQYGLGKFGAFSFNDNLIPLIIAWLCFTIGWFALLHLIAKNNGFKEED